jgi:magnesium-transporting ATPase (P-type)
MKKKKEVKRSLTKKNPYIKNLISTIVILILLIMAVVVIKNLSTTGKAIDPNNPDDPLGIGLNPSEIPDNPEDLGNVTTQYLKREWADLLRNPDSTLGRFFSPLMKAYDKSKPYLDPFFKYTIGVEMGLNWLFILTLVIWITLVTLFYRIISLYSTFSKWISLIISLCVIIIISNLGVAKKLAEFIINTISLADKWWVQLIIMLIVLALLILGSYFSKEFKAWQEGIEERKKKMQQELDINLLKAQQKGDEKVKEALKEGFKDMASGI